MNAKSKHLHDIQTMSNRLSDTEKSQRKFIKLAILEMEKVRRSKEKRRACQRMKNLNKRLAEIKAEQAVLIESVHIVHQGACPADINPPHAKNLISQNVQNNPKKTDFQITY